MEPVVTKGGEIYARSYAFEWKIKDFSVDDKKVGDCIISPVFFDRWFIELYPKNEKPERQDFFCAYLHNERDEATTASGRISILYDSGSRYCTLPIGKVRFEKNGVYPSGWGGNFTCSRDDVLHSVLVNGTLTMLCEINVEPEVDLCLESGRAVSTLEDYETMLSSGEFSDVTFLIGGKKIEAHKVVLAARSAVFKAMFAHQVIENQQNFVEIKDIDHDVFKELLRFIYAGRVEGIDEIAGMLLPAADKYAIGDLVKRCENCLISRLAVGNALAYLKLADHCNAPKLKERAIGYIAKNSEEFVDLPEFLSLVRTHPDVFLEVTRSLLRMNICK